MNNTTTEPEEYTPETLDEIRTELREVEKLIEKAQSAGEPVTDLVRRTMSLGEEFLAVFLVLAQQKLGDIALNPDV